MRKRIVAALTVLSFGMSPFGVYAESQPEVDDRLVAVSCEREAQALDLSADPTIQAEAQLYKNISTGVMAPGAAATVYFLLMKSADEALLLKNQQARELLSQYLKLRGALVQAQAEFSEIMKRTHDFVVQHDLSADIQEMKAKGINDPKYFLDKKNVSQSERMKFTKLATDRINNTVEQHRLSREIGTLTENLKRQGVINFVRFGDLRAQRLIGSYEKRATSIMERIERARPKRIAAGAVGAAIWIGGALVFTMANGLAESSDKAEELILAATLECMARHQERIEAPVTSDEQIDYNMLRHLQDPSNPFPFHKQKE